MSACTSSEDLSHVEALKSRGNEGFQKGNIVEAIDHYQEAIDSVEKIQKGGQSGGSHEVVILKATIWSNLAMAQLKRCEDLEHTGPSPSNDFQTGMNEVIDHTTNAIISLDGLASLPAPSSASVRGLRSKLLYRRSKARYGIAVDMAAHAPADGLSSSSKSELVRCFASAQKDLQQLLSFDANNKAAKSMFQKLQACTSKTLSNAGISSSASPLDNAIDALRDVTRIGEYIRDDDVERARKSLRFIHASILDDVAGAVQDLLKQDNGGGRMLVRIAFSEQGVGREVDGGIVELQTLAIQSLTSACASPAFVASLKEQILNPMGRAVVERHLSTIIRSSSCGNNGVQIYQELCNAAMVFQMRLTLYSHLEQDQYHYNHPDKGDENQEGTDGNGPQCIFGNDHQAAIISSALESPNEKCRCAALSLLSAWLDPNPLHVLQQSISNQVGGCSSESERDDRHGKNALLALHSQTKEPTEEEVRQMTPRDLAYYRRRCSRRSGSQKRRSRECALRFCALGGLDWIVSSAVASHDEIEERMSGSTEDGDREYWRRECTISCGRIVNHIRDEYAKREKDEDGTFIDENVKDTVRTFFFNKQDADHRLTIEEIDDADDADVDIDEPPIDEKLLKSMKKCLFATSLLIGNGEIGSWALTHVWKDSRSDWNILASTSNLSDTFKDYRAMSIAAEFASAAAGVEGARPWITSCVDASSDDGIWRQLLSCDDRGVRSGAASAMAKLGLADKTVSSDEGELFALLEVAAGLLEESGLESSSSILTVESSTGSNATSYQAPLERGVELLSYLSSKASIKDELTHGFAFSVQPTPSESSVMEKLVQMAQSKANPAVAYSLATIFASLSVSIETLRKEAFAGKEITVEQYDQMQAMGKTKEERKLDEGKKERDSPEAVRSRIKSMAKQNVPRALVSLIDGATDATLEHIVMAMMRMADEQTVRGAMVQQGCLTACIKLIKSGDLSEPEKKIMQFAEHTIAKILVTTNPSLLTTSQCMGSIQPLVMLVRDNDSSDLQKFEALLSLTNLASYNDSTKQHIISERGIRVLSVAMFSGHEMVRRAATEAMSNLVPHPDMIDHLRMKDNLKVWVAFAADYDDNFECARASLGCLAMVTQDPDIASTFVNHVDLSEKLLKSVLEFGNLELMHRALILTLNLIEHGGKCKELVMSTGTLAFCDAYATAYQNGGKSMNLEFSEDDQKLMGVTVSLSQEIVRAFSR